MIPVAVKINGETLNLQVDPGAVTRKMTDQAQRLGLAGNTVPVSELPDVTTWQMNFLCGVLATNYPGLDPQHVSLPSISESFTGSDGKCVRGAPRL